MISFPFFGTFVNTVAVALGGTVGVLFRKKLKKSFCDSLMTALGVSVLFIGVSGVLKGLFVVKDGALDTQNTMLLIFSLVLGTIIGELIDIEKQTKRFGEYLKQKAHAENDAGFVGSFVSSSLTVCIGAMAILGPIEEALTNDSTTLLAKSLLDFLIVMLFGAATGIGSAFAAIPILFYESVITLLALCAGEVLTTELISNMSFTGAVLIFLVGVNLTFDKKIKVANMLPTIFMAIPMTYVCRFL